MKVTEHFRMESPDQLVYTFTVEDDNVWTAPFTGEYAWPRSTNKVFEYACHEANYALEGIMKERVCWKRNSVVKSLKGCLTQLDRRYKQKFN